MFAVALTHIGLLLAFAGFVSLLTPLAFTGIRTRSRAAAAAGAGIALTVAGLTLPTPEHVSHRPTSALDRVTPAYQFHEVHSTTVHAAPERIYRAIKEVRPDEILFFETLIWIRRFGRPLPAGILNAPPHRPLLDVATATTFATLADGPQEIVVGTVVVAPPGSRIGQPPTADEFLALRHRGGHALAAMNFLITPRTDGTCVVSTETRVFATDPPARRRFAAYWRIIYPGSALIRRMWLRAIRTRAEARHRPRESAPDARGDGSEHPRRTLAQLGRSGRTDNRAQQQVWRSRVSTGDHEIGRF